MWNSIRTRLTIILFGLAIGPLLIAGIILAQRSFTTEQRVAYDLQTQVAQNVSSEVEALLQAIVNELSSLGNEVRSPQEADRAQRLSILLGALSTGPYRDAFEELTLLNGSGMEQIRLSRQEVIPESELKTHAGIDEFEVPKSTRSTYFSPVQSDETSGESFITIAIPLYEPRSVELSGVLVARVRFETIGNLLRHVRVGEDQTVYITDKNGNLLAHQGSAVEPQASQIALPAQVNTQRGLNKTNVVLAVNQIQLGNQDLFVVAEKPASKALALARSTIITIVVIITAAILLAGVLGFQAVRQIVIPIEELAVTAENVTAGDLSQRVRIKRQDEIGALGTAFNTMTSQLRDFIGNLEQRVAERTASLADATLESERRAKQFEAITLVGGAISSIRSLEDLLPRITELISQHFGYYQVGIFLNDANNENAVLSAANSDGGRRMILRGHRLKIGQQGIVGYAISTGEPRIALDVGEDAVYFGNPELPDTRSEMALPLKIGETVIGALDVQSTEASAFGDEDISVLSLLADQVSLAIENARLFDQARKSLAESEALYRQYLRQAWNRLPKEQNLAGYRYNVRGASPIDAKTQVEAPEEQLRPRISVPIAIRGETIGTLAVQVPEKSSIGEDQMDLVNAVAERVALSVENARLFEETTRRAERERLVSDITVKLRSTNDPDTMIETALEELKQALGATKVQLVPHTLQKSETKQQPVEPAPRSNGRPSRKSGQK